MSLAFRRTLMAFGLLAAGGCAEPVARTAPALFTTGHLRDALVERRSVAGESPSRWVTLRNEQIEPLSRAGGEPRLQASEVDGLNVHAAFSEGRAAAYQVAEVWENIPEVWVQPWYRLVTAYDPANPSDSALADARPLIDIGGESLFYSPFWQFIYVEVPADTAPDAFTDVSVLLDAVTARGFRRFEGGAILATLAPDDIRPAVAQGATGSERPLTREPVRRATGIRTWLDGREVMTLSFGSELGFTWNRRTGVIDEVPLFLFAKQNPETGDLEDLDLPGVMGVGPLGAAKPAPLTSTGAPRYGGLSRPHRAVLPRTAAPFIPSSQGALRAEFASRGLPVVDVNPAIEARPDAADVMRPYLLRVALNPDTCWGTKAVAASFPQGCQWLDSQAAIEASISPTQLHARDVLYTSPFVFHDGKRLPGGVTTPGPLSHDSGAQQ